ncbi:MAG: hypothetical protein AAGB48_09620 [Planctomycetota bacterium]
MALIYCGIDEAGYGPMLGPLCVARSLFVAEDHPADANVPDLWERLAPAVCRTLKEWRAGDRSRVPIADSKRLKLPNDSVRQHPLRHLERGVLAAMASIGASPGDDASLLTTLNAHLPEASWYGGPAVTLPLANEPDSIALGANLLAHAFRRSGVRLDDASCRVIGEQEFNTSLDRAGSKAAVVADAVVGHLRSVRDRYGRDGEHLRIVCDRLGSRAGYGALLAQVWDSGAIETVAESPACSAYAVRGCGATCRVLFMTESESRHLPVAFASMAAKLVRELAMRRLNRYFAMRRPELKPTAGYVQDARRWLEDLSPTGRERAALVRNA